MGSIPANFPCLELRTAKDSQDRQIFWLWAWNCENEVSIAPYADPAFESAMARRDKLYLYGVRF
jgi:hypothetical protein